MVLMRLRDLDKVAYVRFASVYKEFQDLDEFTSELKAAGAAVADAAPAIQREAARTCVCRSSASTRSSRSRATRTTATPASTSTLPTT